MPRATVNVSDTERFDLRTCTGGFVELRKMNYGEMLKRRGMAGEMVYKSSATSRKEMEATLKLANAEVIKFEFRNCIVDHNLTDDNDVALDFRSVETLNKLDPKIGEEISKLIDDMNQLPDEEDDGDLGNSPSVLKPVST